MLDKRYYLKEIKIELEVRYQPYVVTRLWLHASRPGTVLAMLCDWLAN